MRTFIFACPHNAGRSQMASAFFNSFADIDSAHALSAATRPRTRVNAKVVKVMREVGIDVDGLKPQRWTRHLTRGPAQLVTLGRESERPFLPGMGHIDWPLSDIKGLRIHELRALRDDIRNRVLDLLRDESVGPQNRQITHVIDAPAVHFPQRLSTEEAARNF